MSATIPIKQKLRNVAKSIIDDPTDDLANTISWRAVEALLAGPGSTAWQVYMEMLVGTDNPAQLARLTLQDSLGTDPEIRRNCAYVVGNGVCGPITTTRTFLKVSDIIESGLG